VVKADPYRLSGPARPEPASRPTARGEVTRALLWTVLVIGVAANMAASFSEVPTALHLACGLVTALAAAALGVRALRGRGRR
jgi:4-hydroxybenzoate polyprenyltransferase